MYTLFKNVVKYFKSQSADHTFIMVISTPTCHNYNTPLVWYVFTMYSQLGRVVYSYWRKPLALQECSYQAFSLSETSVH